MVTACSQWIHSSSQLWGHVAAGKTNGWKCISIVSTERGDLWHGSNPAEQQTLPLRLQGSVSGPATQWVSSFGPQKFAPHVILHKCICACPLDCYGFHCLSSWSLRKRGCKMNISLPGGSFLSVVLLVWSRHQSTPPAPTFNQKVKARKS